MSSLENKMKKLITSHEILAVELNNKITNYCEEHNRILTQICMKLEYDKLFYQNLSSVINNGVSGDGVGGGGGGGVVGAGGDDNISGQSLLCKRNCSRKDKIITNRRSNRKCNNRHELNSSETVIGHNTTKLPCPTAIDKLQTYCQKMTKMISNPNEDDNSDKSSTGTNNCIQRNNHTNAGKLLSKPSPAVTTEENEQHQERNKQQTDDINLKHILKALSTCYQTMNATQKSSKGRKNSTIHHNISHRRNNTNNHYSSPSTDDDNSSDSNQSSSRSNSIITIFENNCRNLSSKKNTSIRK